MNDLEECWKDIRAYSGSSENEATQLDKSLLKAYKMAWERLAKECTGQEEVSLLAARAVGLFMDEWRKALQGQNLSGLVEIVLDGQDLSVEEMKGFVQALPYSLLERICKSAMNTASGIHGLMAVEFAHRKRDILNYNIVRDGKRFYVEFTTLGDLPIKFYLDEKFDLDDKVRGE